MSITKFQSREYDKLLNIRASVNTGTAIIYRKKLNYLKYGMDDNNRIIKVEFDDLVVVNL